MIVSDSAKMCFIHIPKTAGSTVTRALDEVWPDARMLGGKHVGVRNRIFDEVPAEYFVFGFVRDPLQRCRSWYSMLRRVQQRAPAQDRTAFQQLACSVIAMTTDFDDFVGLLANGEPNDPPHIGLVRASQVSFVYDRDTVLRADFVGKTESIGADLAHALAQGAIDIDPGRVKALTAQRHNTSRPVREVEPVDSDTRATIERLYAEDYDAFGYKRAC